MNVFDRPTPRIELRVYTPETLIDEAHRRMTEDGFATFREAMEIVRISHGLHPDSDLFPIILESSS